MHTGTYSPTLSGLSQLDLFPHLLFTMVNRIIILSGPSWHARGLEGHYCGKMLLQLGVHFIAFIHTASILCTCTCPCHEYNFVVFLVTSHHVRTIKIDQVNCGQKETRETATGSRTTIHYIRTTDQFCHAGRVRNCRKKLLNRHQVVYNLYVSFSV